MEYAAASRSPDATYVEEAGNCMIDGSALINPPIVTDKVLMRLATIIEIKPAGLILRFDGEAEPGQKPYKHISTYTPVDGHRVLVALIRGSGVVLGAIV
jgi:hypothetical protein